MATELNWVWKEAMVCNQELACRDPEKTPNASAMRATKTETQTDDLKYTCPQLLHF
jgi:hypothetical protein